MPHIPLRRKLLEELDDVDRSFKRARLSKYLQDVSIEPFLLSANDSGSANVSSISSVSSVSSVSSFDSDDESFFHPSLSLSPSDVEELYASVMQARIDKLRREIEVFTSRVLRENPAIKKASQFHLLEQWRHGNLNQYRKKVRVDPGIFDSIVDKIRDHDIFHNNSNVPQAPVKVQLAIFLLRAGHYGNAASPEAIGHWAGVSPSTVLNSTNRVMLALISLHDECVHLPTAEEKESAREWVAEQVCPEWSNGYLMVDGTKFSLSPRPGDTRFDKNRDYSLDCQLVTLPDSLIIVDYTILHTSSVHDSLAFQSTRVFKEHERILAPGEWIWADSAYPAKTWCVAPFQKPIGGELSADQRTYNYHVSKVRIRSEHAIGLLKGRFRALRELRIPITSPRHHKWAIVFVRCCIILHNLILRLEGGNFDPEFREHLYKAGRGYPAPQILDVGDNDDPHGSDGGPQEARRHVETEGQRFRQHIMARLFSSESSGAVRQTA